MNHGNRCAGRGRTAEEGDAAPLEVEGQKRWEGGGQNTKILVQQKLGGKHTTAASWRQDPGSWSPGFSIPVLDAGRSALLSIHRRSKLEGEQSERKG